MALKPVTDPNLIAQLETAPAAPAAGMKPVTDPALLAQLNAPATPAEPSLEDIVPGSPEEAAYKAKHPERFSTQGDANTPEPGLWDRLTSGFKDDPIISMWADALPTIAKGAPEVLLNTVNNAGVAMGAGLTAPMVAQNDDDSANYVNDFMAENVRHPTGESAKRLTEGLAEALGPIEDIKNAMGDTTLDATGSPLAATGAHMTPDLLLTILGAEGASAGAKAIPKALKADTPVSPMVENLRAADIRMRPSDVKAMHPSADVPGTFRERFADAPELKKDMTLHNQDRFTKMAGEELGVETGVSGLDDAAFTKAREPSGATYDMVEDVLRDRPMAPETIDTFREALDSIKLELPRGEKLSLTGVLGKLRKRAAKRIQSDNPEMEAKGFADRNMAEALEDRLESELKSAGEPQLFDEYKAARQNFAKVNDVETATRGGQVDANILYKLGQKGTKLSGRLKLIADAAEHAPNVTKHSSTTAARAGGEIESSREGMIKSMLKAGVRKIPGMDVGSKSFQETLGLPDPSRVSYYGRATDVEPAPGPTQGGLDLREALQLEAPPGTVGNPLRMPREVGQQADAFGLPFEFEMAPGEVGVPPPQQMSLQDILGLGEPLEMQKSPGRVGKPKRKS